MKYVIDIDGTICEEHDINDGHEIRPITKRRPYEDRIEKINKLYDEGHTIIYLTARGIKSGRGESHYRPITEQQLKDWGCKYHELAFKRHDADMFIDDKAIYPIDFFDDLNQTRSWMINHDKKIVFILCNKNMSLTLESNLPGYGFRRVRDYPVNKVMDYSFFMIVRDPISRWISGINEVLVYRSGNIMDKKKWVMSKLGSTNLAFDQHLTPQYRNVEFIHVYNLKCSMIKMTHPYGESLESVNMNTKLSSIVGQTVHLDQLNYAGDRILDNHIEFAQEMFNQYCKNNDEFYDYFKKDFELYKKAIL